jgi:hypothetical protein
MPTPAGLPTVAEMHAGDFDLFVTCSGCSGSRPADLAGLVRRGLGDRSPYDLRWRCADCGGRRVSFTVCPLRSLAERYSLSL